MATTQTSDALQAEAQALAGAIAGLSEADLGRPSPCPPWTVAGLLGHVVIAASRIGEAVAAAGAGDMQGRLIAARDYYRPDQRFSAGVNADRIERAAALAAELRTITAFMAALTTSCANSLGLLDTASPGQEVRTRHGDRMLLSEFAITRVVELGVHGLDLATALGREPWLTPEAATVLDDLLVLGGAAALQAELGCTRVGLIARLTGRTPLSAADSAVLNSHSLHPLPLG